MNKKKKISLLVAAISAAAFAAPGYAAKFNAGETEVTLGGYAKFDVSYNDPGLAVSGTVVSPSVGRKVSQGADATIDMSARESRIWLKTSTETDAGTLNTHIEGDFYGTAGNEIVSNSNSFRIRHAYGSMNGILMGQTWSTFMDLAGLGEMLDFTQHASVIFVRQAQVRYTQSLENGKLMLAAENPNTLATDNNNIPDLVARYDANSRDKRSHASAALLVRQLKNASDDDKIGAALSLTGKFKIGSNGDDLRVQLNHGALGRYMGLAAHAASKGAGATFDTLDSTGASIAYKHVWGKGVRSTLMLAATDAETGTTLKGVQSVHANIVWDVTKQVRMGVEVQRKSYDFHAEGVADVDLDRIQFSTRYLF